jgi:hypothetical protein
VARCFLLLAALLACGGCGTPDVGIVVDIDSRIESVPAATVIPGLVDSSDGGVDLPFEGVDNIYSRPNYQYANRKMHRYSGQTITLFLTIGDDANRVVVATVEPRHANLDIFTIHVGGTISDDGYHRNDPPDRTIYLPSLQDTIYIYADSADTRYL